MLYEKNSLKSCKTEYLIGHTYVLDLKLRMLYIIQKGSKNLWHNSNIFKLMNQKG